MQLWNLSGLNEFKILRFPMTRKKNDWLLNLQQYLFSIVSTYRLELKYSFQNHKPVKNQRNYLLSSSLVSLLGDCATAW